jgi:hypothetical protein
LRGDLPSINSVALCWHLAGLCGAPVEERTLRAVRHEFQQQLDAYTTLSAFDRECLRAWREKQDSASTRDELPAPADDRVEQARWVMALINRCGEKQLLQMALKAIDGLATNE